MTGIDSSLDATLIGFTKLGISARGIDVAETFPEITDKHVMVTGATGGIGRAVAQRLASNGAVVHCVGRSREKLAALKAATDGIVVTYRADLSSMEAISQLSADFLDAGHSLSGIVNNVGIMTHERVTTGEGFELSYAVNLLGQYVLTTNLLPALRSGAPARIVMVSSGGMYSQPLTTRNMQSIEGTYDGTAAYARTKRGQVALAEHWARMFADDDIRANSMHPGWVDTEGVRGALPTFRRFTRPFLRNEDQGADSVVWLIAARDAEKLTGQFIHDRRPRSTHRAKRTRDYGTRTDQFIAMLTADAAPYTTGGAGDPREDSHGTNR